MNAIEGYRHGSQILFLGLALLAAALPGVSRANGTFKDVTETVGLSGMGSGKAAWGDYDNDGWTDLLDDGGKVWKNTRGTFTLANTVNGPGVWGDYDNDGYLDIFSYDSHKLYRNVGGTSFVDETAQLPTLPEQISRGAVWADFDGDGFLDLYVGGYEVWEPAKDYPDLILRNKGDGRFEPAWQQTPPIRRARGVTAADFDEDGDQDVYVSNYRLQPNLLWLNDATGAFTDVAAAYGAAGDGDLGAWGHTIGSAWGDLDNDGHLDLFVGNFSHPAKYQDRPKFLKNLGPEGSFRFEDKSASAGLHWQESYASPALGDFDNDGCLDLFFTTVYGGDRSVLYRNNGDWSFSDVTAKAGVATETTYQAAWADYDNDGDLDLISGGRLFRNTGNGNHWLKVRLVGNGRINRAAIGAQVRVRLGERTLTRQVEAGTGEGNQNDLMLHFGLGGKTDSVEVEIRWPDGTRQELDALPDRLLVIRPAR